jgi:hypothetical protein
VLRAELYSWFADDFSSPIVRKAASSSLSSVCFASRCRGLYIEDESHETEICSVE